MLEKLAYRKHLDAIRGMACMAVILFHCNVPYMENGWIGVDVFFVLSGFLITSILLREILESGRVDFQRFYCRRFIRLFPASAAVLNVTAILFRCTELPKYVLMHKKSFIASSLYYQNWHGLEIALDYFTNEGSDQSPVIHFWSLSIEEQFYACFPLFLLIVSHICKNKHWLLLVFFLAFTFVFMAVNVELYVGSKMVSYFSSWGRVYQFSLGSINSIMLLIFQGRCFKVQKKVKSFCGQFADCLSLFVLISLCGLLAIPKTSPLFLGFSTALLTFMLITLLEVSSENNVFKSYIFHNNFLCFVGKLSYGMYLVHLPFIKLGDINSILPVDGLIRPASVFFFTFAIANFINTFIEEPVKMYCKNLTYSKTLLVFIVLTSFQPILLNQFLSLDLSFTLGSYFCTGVSTQMGATPLLNGNIAAINTEALQNGMILDKELLKLCGYLPKDLGILVAGDSYSYHWSSLFRELHETCGIKALYGSFGQAGAPFFPVYSWSLGAGEQIEGALKKDPNTIARKALAYIQENKTEISLYFTRSLHTANIKFSKHGSEISARKQQRFWQQVLRIEIPKFIESVIPFTHPVFMIMHQLPKFRGVIACLKKLEKQASNTSEICPMTLYEEPGVSFLREFYKEMSKKYPKFHYIDMGPLFIGETPEPRVFSALYEGVPIFQDAEHISKPFAKNKLPVLLSELRRLKLL